MTEQTGMSGKVVTQVERDPLLLVVDNPEILHHILQVIGKQSWTHHCCPTVTEAVELLKEPRLAFSLIVLDHDHHDGDPWSVLTAACTRLPTVPVLMLTGNGDDQSAGECIERGAIDYMVKSERFWQLLPAAIERTLRIAAAASNRSRLAAIIESSPDAIYTLDLNGLIQTWNPAAEQLYGIESDQVIGQAILDFVPEQDRSALQIGFERARDGIRQRFVSLRRCAGGTSVPVTCAMSPIIDALHGTQAVVVVEQDRRPRVDAQRLQKRSRELSRINAELDQFAAIAAHDLQAPMRLACLQLDLLAQQALERLDDDDQRLLSEAQNTLRRSGEMIGRILAYAREASVDLKEDCAVDTTAVCQQAIRNLQAQIDEEHASVDCEPLPKVYCDHSQLLRIFQNLIGNAIRYRHAQRRPTVHISSQRDGDHYLAIDIKDNGRGVDSANVETLFRLFRRSAEDDVSGNGIGLAVCRKLVEARGGSLALAESSDEGSTFRFTLPRVARPESDSLNRDTLH